MIFPFDSIHRECKPKLKTMIRITKWQGKFYGVDTIDIDDHAEMEIIQHCIEEDGAVILIDKIENLEDFVGIKPDDVIMIADDET